MFKMFKKSNTAVQMFTSIISEDANINGDFSSSSGNVIINGNVSGKIIVYGSVKISSMCGATFISGEDVIIDGFLTKCDLIEGKNVVITSKVTNQSVIKKIKYETLSIEKGAVLDGTILEYCKVEKL